VFVEWRREDGRWVVSSFGSIREYFPPDSTPAADEAIPARNRGEPLRLPLPADARYAAKKAWFLSHQPIMVEGARLTKYGPPRRLGPDEARWLVLWGTWRRRLLRTTAGPGSSISPWTRTAPSSRTSTRSGTAVSIDGRFRGEVTRRLEFGGTYR
jgi:hypothetical protein